MRLLAAALLMLFIVMCQSCTVEKRRYMDGYHVEWHHRNHRTENLTSQSYATTDTGSVVVQSTSTTRNDIAEETNELVKSVAESPAQTTDGNVLPSSVMTQKLEVADAGNQQTSTQHVTVRSERIHYAVPSGWRHYPANRGSLTLNDKLSTNSDLILLIIALFISPIAVFLHEGRWNSTCWINLILFICFILPGIIHAFWVILR